MISFQKKKGVQLIETPF